MFFSLSQIKLMVLVIISSVYEGFWVKPKQSAASYSPSPPGPFRILSIGWNYFLFSFTKNNWTGA